MGKTLEKSLNFDDPTLEETEMHQRMAEEIQLEELYSGNIKSKNYKKYERFLGAVTSSGINVEDIFADIQIKKRHLREIMGYKALIGKDNVPVPLDNAKDSRIGKVYLHHYNLARRLHNK